MITGTPPVPNDPAVMMAGFLPSEHMGLTAKPDFTDEECHAYARATCGANAPFEPFLLDAVRRTDGRARATMFAAASAGWGADQRHIVETMTTPLAVVSGGDEAFVNNAYLTSIAYGALWGGQVHVLPGVGHAPFWEAPADFDPIFGRFLAEVL
jgi:pimeloyl-ACP methyl ester carboxylesterase